ncbi:hypothetical protein GCM10009409_23020 [Shewanella saliphila]|uniref:Uncharacterized protein n=1 Tax=Shewanella saliphila TaxID=2282698 RepID=A0ABQ2Q8V0_9GAMM|nr:hypothetical protein GCM10009409_23020 [Shewanella saliphila]
MGVSVFRLNCHSQKTSIKNELAAHNNGFSALSPQVLFALCEEYSKPLFDLYGGSDIILFKIIFSDRIG